MMCQGRGCPVRFAGQPVARKTHSREPGSSGAKMPKLDGITAAQRIARERIAFVILMAFTARRSPPTALLEASRSRNDNGAPPIWVERVTVLPV